MLALMLKIGDELYAIPARSVIEVVPRVALQTLSRAPSWLAGLFPYRGKPISVVDLCMLVQQRPCASLLSSRIVVVERTSAQGSERYGILSERVTDVSRLPDSELHLVPAAAAPYVTGTVLEQGKIVHMLALDAVLPQAFSSLLGSGA